MNDDEFTSALRSRGLRVTQPRLQVHRRVRDARGHVTADEIGASLPGVSAGTVYAALELLEEMGIARRVSTLGGTTVFDSRPDPHHHAICRRCGRMQDIEPAAGVSARAPAGFRVERTEAQLVGLCAECARSPRSS